MAGSPTFSNSNFNAIFGAVNTVKDAMNAGQAVQDNGIDSGITTPLGGGVLSKALDTAAPLLGAAQSAFPMAGAVTAGIGALQKVGGMIQKKKAQDMFPQGEDPELRALATNFARRKRAFQTGTALNSQNSAIAGLNKQGINAAFNAGGGQAGINRIAQMTAQAMGAQQNQALQGEMAYGQQEAAMVDKLAQTKLQKSLLQYNQAMAQQAQTNTNANRNLMLGLAKTLPLGNVQNTEWNQTNNAQQNVVQAPVTEQYG